MQRIPARSWWALVIVGLAGQVAWTIENLYLNLVIYDTITDSPGAEDETNGLLTYDRRVVKIDEGVVRAVTSQLRVGAV